MSAADGTMAAMTDLQQVAEGQEFPVVGRNTGILRFPSGSVPEGLGEFAKYRKTALAEAVRVPEPFEVETLEGTMTGKAGDYLMRGAKGELYVCDAGVFEDTYEPAEPGA